MDYGVIGMPLGHSFSKPIHERLGGYVYDVCPVTEAEAKALLEERRFKGINVTIPYKQFVLPFCDEIDPAAKAIGSVNTIVNVNGRLVAHNTDFAGFLYLARSAGVSFRGKTVLILGGGGTQKTVAAVARSEGAARVLTASRRMGPDTLDYENALLEKGVQVLVNTTPVGMYPNCGGCPMDPASFPRLEGVLDAVYNPLESRLVQKARALGVPAAGGLPMLVAQAKYAAEYFLGKPLPDACIPSVTKEMWEQRANLVLTGMPGSGKTSIGKALARRMGRPFVDMDQAVAQAAGKSIAEIFSQEGEEAFRALEAEAVAAAAKEMGQVIATGGGSVLRQENTDRLRQNGVLIHITRPLCELETGNGRPLSQTSGDIQALWQARRPLYEATAHCQALNAGTVEQAAEAAYSAFMAAAKPYTVERIL